MVAEDFSLRNLITPQANGYGYSRSKMNIFILTLNLKKNNTKVMLWTMTFLKKI
jgi:hypothetical protein